MPQKGIIGFGSFDSSTTTTPEASQKSKGKKKTSTVQLSVSKSQKKKLKAKAKNKSKSKDTTTKSGTNGPNLENENEIKTKTVRSKRSRDTKAPPSVATKLPKAKKGKPSTNGSSESSMSNTGPGSIDDNLDDQLLIKQMAENARQERAQRKKPTHVERKRERGRNRMEKIKAGVRPSGSGFETELGTEEQDFDSLLYLSEHNLADNEEEDTTSKHGVKTSKLTFAQLKEKLIATPQEALGDEFKSSSSSKSITSDVWKLPERPDNDVVPSYSDYSNSSDDDEVEDAIDPEEIQLSFLVSEPQDDHLSGLSSLADTTFSGKSVIGTLKYDNLGYEIATHILARRSWLGTVITPDEQLHPDIQVFAFLSIINPYANANLQFISTTCSSWSSSCNLASTKKWLTLPDIVGTDTGKSSSDGTLTTTLSYDPNSKTKLLTPFPHSVDDIVLGLVLWNQIINLPTDLSIRLWEKTEKELIWARKDGFLEYSFNLLCIPTFILKNAKGSKNSTDSSYNSPEWAPFDNTKSLFSDSGSESEAGSEIVRFLPNIPPLFSNKVPDDWVFLTPAAEEFYTQAAACDMISPKTSSGNFQYPVSTLFSQKGSKSHHLKMLLIFISPKNLSTIITKLKSEYA